MRLHNIDIIHAHDGNRVIAFIRREATSEMLVIVSLNNRPYLDGYVIQSTPARLSDGMWRETFNSDSVLYGGMNVGNYGAQMPVRNGRLELQLPANGLLVLQRM